MQFEVFVLSGNSIMRSSEVPASAMLSECKKYECVRVISNCISAEWNCVQIGQMLAGMLNSKKKKNSNLQTWWIVHWNK